MTQEQAAALLRELDEVCAQARTMLQGKDPGQLITRPPSGAWSVAENIEHLVLTADVMVPLIENGIRELESKGVKATGKTGLGIIGWLLVKMIEPPSRFKVKAPPRFNPAAAPPPAKLLEDFVAVHERLRSLIQRGTGLATGSAYFASPFNARAKYNVYAGMRIVLAHDRRHFHQAMAAAHPR